MIELKMFFRRLFTFLTLFSVSIAQNPIAGPFFGDGTYYGAGGSIGGHCSIDQTGSLNLPWAQNLYSTIALNNPQYSNSEGCGICLMYRGLNPSCTTCGTSPVPSDWKYAIVTNECPECKSGDLDQALDGDGRWKIEWYEVQCNVGNSKFHYGLQGANEFYIKLQVANTRYGVQSVSVQHPDGSWESLTRTPDNYFQGGGRYVYPTGVRITSIFGDTVEDTLRFTGYGSSQADGSVQFPDKGYDTVGGGSNPNPPSTTPAPPQTTPAPNPTTPSPTTPIPQTPSPTNPTPTQQTTTTPVPTNPQPTPSPSQIPSPTTTTTQSIPAPTPTKTPSPPQTTPSPPTQTTPSPNTPNGNGNGVKPNESAGDAICCSGGMVGLYHACGGRFGPICYGFDCKDEPWAGYTCETGSCFRNNADYWQCRNFPFNGPSRKLKQI